VIESEVENPAAAEPASPGPGALLRQAREARGMTVAEVAASLKMSPRQIEAVEVEDYSRLSGTTFIRGFIRNYAKLLRIDAAQVLSALEARTALPAAELCVPADSGVRMPSGVDRQGRASLLATFLALALLGIAVALYFNVVDLGALLKLHIGAPAETKSPDRPQARQSEVLPLVQPLPTVVPPPGTEAASAAAATQPMRKPGMSQIVFLFDADSWVEVSDAAGRTIFSQMNPKGTTQVIEGRPPLRMVVGNASYVRVQYNDQAVDLRPHTRVEVARLTLE
jgi:cytoskeleton protein RodZ